jgi:hypothetical protein
MRDASIVDDCFKFRRLAVDLLDVNSSSLAQGRCAQEQDQLPSRA